jgi:2-polyprenyl-3-methyl-5-hydroxy-6-metoxy-1,4-benzoquinol methylase
MLMRQVLYCPKCKNTLEEIADRYFCQHCAHSYPIIDGIPSFVDQNVRVDSFDASLFEFMFEMEQKHFWQIGRKAIVLEVLKRNISNLASCRMLEIGCGDGSVLAYLRQNGINIEGADIFMEGLKFCQQRAYSFVLYQTDILALPFHNGFDIIGIFDVLEHIDNDEKALLEINQALKPRGNLILTVPAHRFLWSYHDEAANHRRRYGKRQLVTELERNGFIIKKISYYVSFLFPLFVAIRLVNKLFRKKGTKRNISASIEFKTIPIINIIFLGLMRLEKQLIGRLDLPFGASLVVLAEKRE